MGEGLQAWSARGDLNCEGEPGQVVVVREADAGGE